MQVVLQKFILKDPVFIETNPEFIV